MHQLHFKAEVRAIKEVGIESTAVSEPELKLADQLIEHLSAKRFDPNEYQDEFKGRVEAAIQRKVAGKEVSLAEPPVAKAGDNVIDLMAALKASLDAKSTPSSAKERKAPKKAVTSKSRKSAAR
jgi:DNA end-binding protein Ku